MAHGMVQRACAQRPSGVLCDACGQFVCCHACQPDCDRSWCRWLDPFLR